MDNVEWWEVESYVERELRDVRRELEEVGRELVRLDNQHVDVVREMSFEIEELRRELEAARSHLHGYVSPPRYGGGGRTLNVEYRCGVPGCRDPHPDAEHPVKKCSNCNGSGVVSVSVVHPTNPNLDTWESRLCGSCNGKG